MTGPSTRLAQLARQFIPSSSPPDQFTHRHHIHSLSPTFFLARAASIEPDAIAVYHRAASGNIVRRTYRETAERARSLAHFIKSKGYKRVGILCPNTPAFLEAIYGIAAAGAITVAINYRLKPDDIAYIFDHADVDSILVDAEFEHLLDGFRKSHPAIPFLIDADSYSSSDSPSGPYEQAILEGLEYGRRLGKNGWDGLELHVADEDAVVALSYTSGTTARPKGVEYTSRGAYMAAVANIIDSGLNYHRGRCRYLWTLPMFHAAGWTFPWAVTLVRGTHYCLRKIDYPEIWQLLKEEQITHFNAAPTVCTLLCSDQNAERLQQPVQVTVAASPPSGFLFEKMTELNLEPVHVYGMTETYGPITKGYHMPAWDDMPPKEKFQNMARQGHGFATSLPVRVIKLDQPDGTIIDVEANAEEVGEIVFCGNICAKGYYKDPEATKKLFSGGVLHSGDLAVMHPDGSAQIIDRKKDIIISGGENISSIALESILVTHPDILEAGVAAVQDEQWGERPKAFITVRRKQVTGDDVIAWAKEHPSISRFMVPREVEIVSELPKTSTGKIKKNTLREWAQGSKGNGEAKKILSRL